MKLVLNENIQEVKIDKFKGGEGYIKAFMHFDDNNRILKGTLEKGCTIGSHTHEDSSEIIFILSGKGIAICDGIKEELIPGNIHYCQIGSTHTLINTENEPLVFYAVVPNHRG